jgi:hypothetical protein
MDTELDAAADALAAANAARTSAAVGPAGPLMQRSSWIARP